ncbi:MAG: 1-phosphofructokinase family hexose kinase [Pyrinomonadaceae bacterium]
MIVCISANPAIDKRLIIDELVIGGVNRSRSSIPFAGGKAAHVAMAVKALGEEVAWIGFLGGAAGQQIERQLVELGIDVTAVRTESDTRTNLEIIDKSGTITEILEPGGAVTLDELERFRSTCAESFEKAGNELVVVLSGSLPPGVPKDEYSSLTTIARSFGGKVIVDASGAALDASLAAAPDLIKPNWSEAEHASGVSIRNHDDAVDAARILTDRGAKAVALTLGKDGLMFSGPSSAPIFAKPPTVDVVSTVGCGDATVAGFAVAMKRGLDETAAVRLASACGAANCLAELPGQIRRSDVERLMPEIRVQIGADTSSAVVDY